MKIIMRYATVGIIFSVLIALVMISITLLAFPPDDWSVLVSSKLFDINYIVLVTVIPIIIGTFIGISVGWYWRQQLRKIDRQLKELVKGQAITRLSEQDIEMIKINESIEHLQEKWGKLMQISQKQASERAHEREKSLQEVVVQERNRLARELHDSVSQQLFAASMMMSAINEANSTKNSKANDQLAMVEKMIHQSQLEMRALLLHLRPAALKGKSLQEGITELLDELLEKVPMKVDAKIETFVIDKGIEDHLFRITQESISNTLRHAQASMLHIMLIERDGFIIFRVVDNGLGFDMKTVRTSSYGLESMKERTFEIGGTFKVISLPNQGTRIEVKIPTLKKSEAETDD
ncbi:sensor histidine kinase [Virgibacillus sp. W0430]|uniref:sensor histidine kinase n=1 Tax=Virgibacillus sp. W0430 TaxID=3391580 RepID=UPI003F458947